MRKVNLIIIFVFFLFEVLIISNLHSKIINKIAIKVGNSLITSIDVQNEIITNLIITNQEITQKNVNDNKNFATKSLIYKLIKKSEIDKYEIKDYSKNDLEIYILNVSKSLNTNKNGLKEIFKQNNINYQAFVDRQKTDLLWNTLIYKLYRNQTNVNIVEVENEVNKNKENKNEEEIKKLRETLLNKRKEEKLNLFSRSRLSNLENNIVIEFQ